MIFVREDLQLISPRHSESYGRPILCGHRELVLPRLAVRKCGLPEYLLSQPHARMEESKTAEAGTFYDRVYSAERSRSVF